MANDAGDLRRRHDRAMSSTGNLDVFDRWMEAHEERDVDRMLEFVTDDIEIRRSSSDFAARRGKREVRCHWTAVFASFPDLREDVIDVTAEGDTLFAEALLSGTMEGPIGDHPPTGAVFRVRGAFRIDFRDGLIRSVTSYWDTADMARQLGLSER